MKIKCKDIRERLEFDREGYHYRNIYLDDTRHLGIWEMRRQDRIYGYEAIRGKKTKNPDGEYVWTYPCDEDFGRYGYYVAGTDTTRCREIIHEWEKEIDARDASQSE